MAIFSYNGIGISGFSGVVPKHIFNNYVDNPNFSKEDAKAIVDKTGIFERRVADDQTCSSDLCFVASEKLFSSLGVDKSEIDVLIFVTQTPDFRMPASAIILQDRLGLPTSCAAFDVNLGCSGFVYGLNMAYSFAQQSSIRKVLLLNGETRTKVYSFKDRKTGFLFGDAGTACIIEKDSSVGKAIFALDSFGDKADAIKVKAGGYRFPSSCETVKEKIQTDGGIRSDEQGFMDGAGVFEFVLMHVPKHLKNLLLKAEITQDDIDFYIFHQANKFMNDHLIKKLKLPEEKVPYSVAKFGNTSSVSIPITITSELGEKINNGVHKLMISGFGVGLSLGSAIIEVKDVHIADIVEV